MDILSGFPIILIITFFILFHVTAWAKNKIVIKTSDKIQEEKKDSQ